MDFLSQLPLVQLSEHHQLHKDVVDDFHELQIAAKNDGISLDIASSYRSIERQLLIWNNKWLGKRPLYNRDGDLLDAQSLSDEEKLRAILTWSALPGASRHHWGTDLDVYDAPSIERCGQPLELTEAEYQAGGPCYDLALWMNKNLEKHGFYRPYLEYKGGVAVEPWHISHRAVSNQLLHLISLTEFEKLLRSLDIEGKDTILTNLEWIFGCYVLNKGQ